MPLNTYLICLLLLLFAIKCLSTQKIIIIFNHFIWKVLSVVDACRLRERACRPNINWLNKKSQTNSSNAFFFFDKFKTVSIKKINDFFRKECSQESKCNKSWHKKYIHNKFIYCTTSPYINLFSDGINLPKAFLFFIFVIYSKRMKKWTREKKEKELVCEIEKLSISLSLSFFSLLIDWYWFYKH